MIRRLARRFLPPSHWDVWALPMRLQSRFCFCALSTQASSRERSSTSTAELYSPDEVLSSRGMYWCGMQPSAWFSASNETKRSMGGHRRCSYTPLTKVNYVSKLCDDLSYFYFV